MIPGELSNKESNRWCPVDINESEIRPAQSVKTNTMNILYSDDIFWSVLLKKEYTVACNYCDFGIEPVTYIPPAKQIK